MEQRRKSSDDRTFEEVALLNQQRTDALVMYVINTMRNSAQKHPIIERIFRAILDEDDHVEVARLINENPIGYELIDALEAGLAKSEHSNIDKSYLEKQRQYSQQLRHRLQ